MYSTALIKMLAVVQEGKKGSESSKGLAFAEALAQGQSLTLFTKRHKN